MWIRSAFFEGRAGQAGEGMFRQAMQEEVAPAIGRLEGVTGVELLWPKAVEDREPTMLCQLLVRFDAEADIALMQNSPGRAAVRECVGRLGSGIDVRISHINYEVA